MNADISLSPFGIHPSILKKMLAVIFNLTSELSLLRDKWKLITVTAVKEQTEKKKVSQKAKSQLA